MFSDGNSGGCQPAGFGSGFLVGGCFHGLAAAPWIKAYERFLQLAGILPGDFGVPLLMALDVARKRVPDESDVMVGAASVGPARQDQLGVQLDLRALDLAAAAGNSELVSMVLNYRECAIV